MSRVLRLAGAGLLMAAAVVASGPAVAAQAAPVSQCSTTRGTIVAADFGHWGGPIIRGCGVQSDGQPDPNPYALLAGGGFTITYVNGEAFVCRIGNAAFAGGASYPTPAEDHCVVTPPASAYWSYWTAAPGATSWHYATMTEKPVAGGLAFWTFGATNDSGTQGGPPASLIDRLRAHNTSPAGGTATNAKPPARSTAAGPVAGVDAGSTSGGAPAPRSSEPAGASPARSAGPATATASTGAGPASPGGSASPSQPGATRVVSSVAPTKHGAGSAVPVAVAAAIVAALGAAGGVSVWRRRRGEPG